MLTHHNGDRPAIAHLVFCNQACAILPLRITDFPESLTDVVRDRGGVLVASPITRVLPDWPNPDTLFCVLFHKTRLTVLAAPRRPDLIAHLRADPELSDIDPDGEASDDDFYGGFFEHAFKRGWIFTMAREDQFAEDLRDVAGMTLDQLDQQARTTSLTHEEI